MIKKDGKKNPEKIKTGRKKTCRFVQPKKLSDGTIPDENRGTIPQILMFLLAQRKKTRTKIKYKTVTVKDGTSYSGLIKQKDTETIITTDLGEKIIIDTDTIDSIKDTYTEFEKNILNGLQLAYKVTANSIYGSIGGKVSPIRCIDIAASTTKIGQMMLQLAGKKVKEFRPETEIVYGDTDSIFVNFHPKDNNGQPLLKKEGLQKTIDIGIEFENYIQPFFITTNFRIRRY